MANSLLTFNSKIVDADILERTLVGRREVVDQIEKELVEKLKKKQTYQCLVVAPRGSGKTHITKVIYNRLKATKSLNKKILIAYMVEDEIGIDNFLDFVVRVLEACIRYREDGSEALKEAIYTISEMPTGQQESAMRKLLLDYIGKRNMVILIENLNIVFEGMGIDAQSKLRDFMHEYNNLSLVATSQNLFAQIQKSEFPFYNFFKTFHLRKITFEEAEELMYIIADMEENEELKHELTKPAVKGKLRAVYELTGGNHRLLVTFYSFLKAEIKSDLSKVFLKTMNDLKPYYEQFIMALSTQQQKIVKHLCLQHTPQMGKDIARACFIAPNTISKILSELFSKGHIDKHKEGKDVYYELKEPLMRICFEINESPDGIAKLFVDFLSVLYSKSELREKYLLFRYGAKFQPEEIQAKFEQEAKMISQALDAKLLERLKRIPELENCESLDDIKNYNTSIVIDELRAILHEWAEDLKSLKGMIKYPISFGNNTYVQKVNLFYNTLNDSIHSLEISPEKLNEFESQLKGIHQSMLKEIGEVCFLGIITMLINFEKCDVQMLLDFDKELKTLSKRIPSFRIPYLYLFVGLRYLKNGDKRAIYELSKEERKVFKEFVLDKRIEKAQEKNTKDNKESKK